MHFAVIPHTHTDAQSDPLLGLPETKLFGLRLANTKMEIALDHLCARLEARWPTRVAFLNAHCANLVARDPAYHDAVASADALLPDGSGIAVALRLKGQQLVENLNGTDLIPALCQRLAESGHSIFLLGGRRGVASEAAAALVAQVPELRIAGSRDGYFSPAIEGSVIREINASGADVVLVAMGVPAQDVWLHRVAPRLQAVLTFGVGGLFDFLSGRIPRAPKVLRRTGLEWTYRLYQEPLRMWRRYLLGNPEFIGRAVADALPLRTTLTGRVDLAAKRMLDVSGAAAGLLALAPLLVATACAVRLTSPGPALLRQTRIGRDGKPFTLLKFRSMYQDAEARRAELLNANQHGGDGVTFKIRRDPRVTWFGRLIRRSSIDELPQLFNVLNGTMSLVGPRPPLPQEVARYTPHQRGRLAAKPGLTCLWQVGGRADLPFPRQVELDLEYVSKRNLLLDLGILARTVPAVLFARGAY